MPQKEPVKTLRLDNDLTLTIRDLSRKIAADVFVVVMEAGIAVPVVRDLFSEKDLEAIPGGFDHLVSVVGDTVQFLKKAERNFILDKDRQAVFDDLVSTLSSMSLAYLSHDSFARKLILKTYRDACKRKGLPG